MGVASGGARWLTALACALALTSVPAVQALAEPTIPSQDQVDQARASASAKAAEVSRISSRLTAVQAQADAAAIALGEAAEDYDEARLELQRRTEQAAAARVAADAARKGLALARREVGRLASKQYRDGGVSTLGVLLASEGPDAVLERATLLTAVGDARGVAMKRMNAKRLVTRRMDARAADAMAAQKAAADSLEAARDRAERQARDARAVAGRVANEQASLSAQLVVLQATSSRLAEQRQAGLEAQRQARLAAAAKARAQALDRARAQAAREKAAKAAAAARAHSGSTRSHSSHGSSGGSSGSGSSSGGSTGGSTNSGGNASGGSSRGSSSAGVAAVAYARARVGLPYQWGGAGPSSYDCSGLTMRAWQSVGVSLPHSSRAQYQVVRKVSYSSMRPGDLIFWGRNTSDPSSIYHVAIYAGGGLMIEAPATGLDIRVTGVRYSGAMPYAGRP